jgi:hypothetical protein
MNDFRSEVLKREHEVVQSLKNEADYIIDFKGEIKLVQINK